MLNPYELVLSEGCYYLICNNDWFDTLSNYRVDRMRRVRILDEPRRDMHTLDGVGSGFTPGTQAREYCEQHLYMFSGDPVSAVLRIHGGGVSTLVDAFGGSVRFDEDERGWLAHVRASAASILMFVRRVGPALEIVSPASLRDQMRKDLESSLKRYRDLPHS